MPTWLKGRLLSGAAYLVTPGTAPPPPPPAGTFTTSQSSNGGAPGSTFTVTAYPDGEWASGEMVTADVTGGTPDATTKPGTGSDPVVFTITAGASGTTSVHLTAPGMVNLSSDSHYTVTAPAVLVANRYDLTLDQSAGPAGVARTVTASPNAVWSGGTIPLTARAGGSSVSVGTITLPTSGSTPQTISWTPPVMASGEWIVQGANTAGMFDPYGAPFNAFSPSSGTAQTITAALSLPNNAVHQRDCPSGNPLGFSLSWARGWGEVWITLSSISGATNGIFVQLRDALNGDAALSGWVQVYGPVSSPGEIRVLLPAGPYVYHLGVSASSDGANAVQLAQRFKVGHNAGVAQRSYECGLSRSFGYGAGATLPTTYLKTATWVSYNAHNGLTDVDPANYTGGAVGWFTHDGGADPYTPHGEGSSSATQEWGRLVENTFGVVGGLVGTSMSTWGLDNFISHDGQLYDGFGGSIHFGARGKVREVILTMSDWDGIDGGAYATATLSEVMTRYTNAVRWIALNFPSVSVISICGGASGLFGDNGSSDLGYTRIQCAIADQLEATNPMVVSRTNIAWNDHSGASGHSSMAARVQYARTGFRQGLAGETAAWGGLQTMNRGPKLTGSGTVNSAGLIRLPGKLNGGTALQAVGVDFNNPSWTVNTASSAEIASLFSVFPSGGRKDAGTAVAITSAVINTSSLPTGADFTIDLQLSGGAPAGDLWVHYGADPGVSNGTIRPDWMGGARRAVFLANDVIDSSHGFEFGWELRQAVDMPVSRI